MQSIGERLEEARKRKGISIREAAEATKIRSDYLHKFESNQFDIKLPEIYVRGFLRTYANYLKSPADKIISDYTALGLSEAKLGRGLNREVYGRMDLSVASAKGEKDPNDATPPMDPNAPPEPGGTRNPATFIPKSAPGLPFDMALLIKGGALVAAALVLVLIGVYFFSNHGEKSTASTAVPTSADIWVRPQAGEMSLAIIALERVQVTVQAENGTLLFQGVLQGGERREIPRRGKLLINSDLPQNLQVDTGGPKPWALQDKSGAFLKSAAINSPSSGR